MKRASLAVVLLTVAACQSTLPIPGLGAKATDEEKIAVVLDDVQRGVETGKVYKVLAHVSPRYHDAQGRDYEDIREYLEFIRRSYRNVRITRTRPRIVVEGDTARALEAFGTIAESQDPDAAPPVNVQGQVTVHLVREDGEWKICEWGELQ
ncbi:MAG TPA: nuclear transport factor 2 family protein [Candidatus Hydrogenedentes bacterium]|nr:nuclear transport factor 2 family protein [Candidatus Hydrogenedentota bacterium]HNT87665.1 nuclear transport factor 2 family protein [Candidatus Hydrogenedentota bacterium]